MKRFFLTVLTAFIGLGTYPLSAVEDGDETAIILEVDSSMNALPPRAPTTVPITCIYYSSLSTINVSFLFDLGFVSIETENLTTGEYNQSIVNSSVSSMLLYISGTNGLWRISFTLTNGIVYSGIFLI